jgi:hypothetical protein
MKIHRMIAVAAVATLAVCSFAQGDPNGGGPGGPPPGQRGPGGPGFRRVGLQPTEMLVRRSDVQTDLALTDDQKSKLHTLLQSMRGPGGPGGPGGGPGGPPPDGGRGGPPPDGGQGGPPPDGGQGGPPPDGGPGGGGNDAFRARMDAMRKKITDGINAILTSDQKTRLKEIQVQLAGNAAAVDTGIQKSLKLTDDQKSKIASLVRSLGEANRAVFDKMRSGDIEPEQVQATLKKNTKILNAEIGKILTTDQTTALTQMSGKTFTSTEPDRGFGGPGGPGGGGPGGPDGGGQGDGQA